MWDVSNPLHDSFIIPFSPIGEIWTVNKQVQIVIVLSLDLTGFSLAISLQCQCGRKRNIRKKGCCCRCILSLYICMFFFDKVYMYVLKKPFRLFLFLVYISFWDRESWKIPILIAKIPNTFVGVLTNYYLSTKQSKTTPLSCGNPQVSVAFVPLLLEC